MSHILNIQFLFSQSQHQIVIDFLLKLAMVQATSIPINVVVAILMMRIANSQKQIKIIFSAKHLSQILTRRELSIVISQLLTLVEATV